MKRRIFCAVIVVVSAYTVTAGASSRSGFAAVDERSIVLKTSELRSAYLLRAGVVHYDVHSNSSESIRRQIRRHFDVVLGLLLVATPQSIETALDRLEADRYETWSASDRERWRQQLLRNRYWQMVRMAAYRDRGLFPQNEGEAAGAVPIFLDRYDTACAVGHLMRLSGWSGAVAAIRLSNNLLYVPDAANSVIARWTLLSGLTLEEAALIQPGYPFIVQQTLAQYGPGESALVRDGLRYENFQISGEKFINPSIGTPRELCQVIPQACLGTPNGSEGIPTASQVGFRVETGTFFEPQTFAYIDPIGTHWLSIGGVTINFHPLVIGGRSQAGQAERITVQFDVSTVAADMMINQLTQHSDPLEGGFFPFPQLLEPDAHYLMISRVIANRNVLATALLDPDTPFRIEGQSGGEQTSTVDFQPQPRITVATDLLIFNGVMIDSFALDFNVVRVPEPMSTMLLLMGAAVLGSQLRRFQRP